MGAGQASENSSTIELFGDKVSRNSFRKAQPEQFQHPNRASNTFPENPRFCE
jgi:hypothetical protein